VSAATYPGGTGTFAGTDPGLTCPDTRPGRLTEGGTYPHVIHIRPAGLDPGAADPGPRRKSNRAQHRHPNLPTRRGSRSRHAVDRDTARVATCDAGYLQHDPTADCANRRPGRAGAGT